jgi:hypothetical protein
VAIGYEVTGSYLCERPSVDGIVWTSSDGENWTESRPEALAGLALKRLVNAGGTLYAFGTVGHRDCADQYVFAVARSVDGSSWDRLQPDLPDSFFFNAIGASEGQLIVLGDDGAWTSLDGTQWQGAVDAPFSYSWFKDIESVGQTVVAFENFAETPIWVSEDMGGSWGPADLVLPYDFSVTNAFASDDRIVALGSACCALPNEPIGLTITSTDGVHWEESGAFRDVLDVGVPLVDGYLAIGQQTWFSQDGLNWQVGPGVPDLDRTEVLTAVSTDAGVLLSSATCCHTAGHANVSAAWFAPSDAFALDRWNEIPPAPEMPEIGVHYPAELYMHCGFPDVSFGLRTWTPDPPFEDDHNPPPGYSDDDRGWLTQLSADELLYESRRGQTVNLVPLESAGRGPCFA